MLKYIARHDDTGAFTHGKIPLNRDEYKSLAPMSTLRAKDSEVLEHLYMSIYHELWSKYTNVTPCKLCGNPDAFLPAPVFSVKHDAECPQCVIKCSVRACCLKCAWENHCQK